MSGHMSRRTASRFQERLPQIRRRRRGSRGPGRGNVLTRTAPAARPSGSRAASTLAAISSAARLLNVTAVMPAGSAPVGHEPRDPRDESRRLATARRSHAQNGTRWRGRRLALVGREPVRVFRRLRRGARAQDRRSGFTRTYRTRGEPNLLMDRTFRPFAPLQQLGTIPMGETTPLVAIDSEPPTTAVEPPVSRTAACGKTGGCVISFVHAFGRGEGAGRRVIQFGHDFGFACAPASSDGATGQQHHAVAEQRRRVAAASDPHGSGGAESAGGRIVEFGRRVGALLVAIGVAPPCDQHAPVAEKSRGVICPDYRHRSRETERAGSRANTTPLKREIARPSCSRRR